MSTVAVIRASADTSTRVERIKKYFGLPSWITRKFSRPNSKEKDFDQDQYDHHQDTTDPMFADEVEEIQFTHLSPHEENLLASINLKELAQPHKQTTKDQIFHFIESRGINGGTNEEIANFFTGLIPANGISSRLSEMTRSGLLVARGKRFNSKGTQVSIYRLKEAEPA